MGRTSFGVGLVFMSWAGASFGQDKLSFEKQPSGVVLVRELREDPLEDGQSFGASLAVLGTRLAISKPYSKANGTVFFVEPDGTISASLTNPAPARESHFGATMAAGDDRLVIGESYGLDSAAGTVHLVDGNGQRVATIEQAGTQKSHFGNALLVAGDEVIVGADGRKCGAKGDEGAIFRYEAATGKFRSETCSPVPHWGGHFGVSLASLDDNLWVGVGMENGQAGFAGLVRVLDGKNRVVRSLYEAQQGLQRYFGAVIVRVGDQMAVAAPQSGRGTVTIFNPTTAEITTTIQAPENASRFGSAMVAVGDDLLIGATHAGIQPGSAFLVDSKSGKIKRTFRGPAAEFGKSVAVWGEYFAIGSPKSQKYAGAVYLFPREGPEEVSATEAEPLNLFPSGLWKEVFAGSFSTVVLDGNMLLAAGPTGVVRSATKGKTWQESLKGEVTAMAAFGGTVYAAATGQGLLISKDSGKTWTKRAVVEDVRALDASEYGVVIGTGTGVVMRSTDQGIHWKPMCLALSGKQKVTSVAGFASSVLFNADATYRYDFATSRCEKLEPKSTLPSLFRGADGAVLTGECDVRTTIDGRTWASPREKGARCKGKVPSKYMAAYSAGDSTFLVNEAGAVAQLRGGKEASLPSLAGTQMTSLVQLDDALIAATPLGLRRYRFSEGEAPAKATRDRDALLKESCEKGSAADCGAWAERLVLRGLKEEARAALNTACEKGGERECALLLDLVLVPQRLAATKSDVVCCLGELVPQQLSKMEKVFTDACQKGDGRSCWRRGALFADADLEKRHAFYKKGCDAKQPDGQSCGMTGLQNPKTETVSLKKACKLGDASSCDEVAPEWEGDKVKDPGAAAKAYVALFSEGCLAGNDAVCDRLGHSMINSEVLLAADLRLGVMLADRLCRGNKLCGVVGELLRRGLRGVPLDEARARTIFERACYQDDATSCAQASGLTSDAVESQALVKQGKEALTHQCRSGEVDAATCRAAGIAGLPPEKPKDAPAAATAINEPPVVYKPVSGRTVTRFTGPELASGQRFRIVEMTAAEVRGSKHLGQLVGSLCVASKPMRATRPALYKGEALCDGILNGFFKDLAVELVDDSAVTETPEGYFKGDQLPRGQKIVIVDVPAASMNDAKKAALVGKHCVTTEQMDRARDEKGFYRGQVRCEGSAAFAPAVRVWVEPTPFRPTWSVVLPPFAKGGPTRFTGDTLDHGATFRVVEASAADVEGRPVVGLPCWSMSMKSIEPGWWTGEANCGSFTGTMTQWKRVAIEVIGAPAVIPARPAGAPAAVPFTGAYIPALTAFRVLSVDPHDKKMAARTDVVGLACVNSVRVMQIDRTGEPTYSGKAQCAGKGEEFQAVSVELIDAATGAPLAIHAPAGGRPLSRETVKAGTRVRIVALTIADANPEGIEEWVGASCVAKSQLTASGNRYSGEVTCQGPYGERTWRAQTLNLEAEK